MPRVHIPAQVKQNARLALEMKRKGFLGGTVTGWRRARQLSRCKTLDERDVKVMRAWFARHGPGARNGGTSYPGYKKWVRSGRPMNSDKSNYRGAVSWLLWGGDAAYRWVARSRS